MKISVFVHDLASNPIGRLHPLISALQLNGHTVEVLGLRISSKHVYLPYRDKYEYISLLSTGNILSVIIQGWKLYRCATGDIVYAGKPLLTSFLPAILASGFGRRKPLFLDIEDDDVWAPDGSDTLQGFINLYIRGFKRATSCKWGVFLHPFIQCTKGLTVSSRKLQKRYGGTIVRHGPDEKLFNPALPELSQTNARLHFNIPFDRVVVSFAGTPHEHKGFGLLLDALAGTSQVFHLLLCGDTEHPLFQKARVMFPNQCTFTGFLPNKMMPIFLAASDVVPILQRNTGYAQAQLPAKLLEAMAMAKMIVATRVGDLPDILGEKTNHPRGWIIEPDNPTALISVLDEIADMPELERNNRGSSARLWFLENASVSTNQKILASFFSGYL